MNLISISHNHSDDKQTACKKAEHMLEDLATSYGLEIESDGEGCISFNGSGITGNVEITNNQIQLNAKLNFLMIAMKTLITNEIKNRLDAEF